MTVITKLPDGRLIARQTITATSILSAGSIALTVSFPDLKKVEYALAVNLSTDPKTNATPQDITTEKNVVGMTVYVGAGTTVSGEVIALGF